MRSVLLSGSLALLMACGKEESRVSQVPVAPPPQVADESGQPSEQTDSRQAQEIGQRLMDAKTPVPEWSPELSIDPEESVESVLEQADQALSEGRLVRGGNSSLALYLAVLEKEPDNERAMSGSDRVVEELKSRLSAALERGDLEAAALYAQTMKRVRSEDQEITLLAEQVAREQQLQLLLGEAERLVEAGRLSEPSGENAASIYREILREAPDNAAAHVGLSRIETALITRASAAAEAGAYAESDRLLAEAGRLRPGSQSVQNASTRIVELRQERANRLMDEANTAVTDGELEKADDLLRELGEVSAQAQGLDALRERIEHARIYGGRRPGSVFADNLAVAGEGPALVVIPIGEFTMGSPSREHERKPNEGPQRTISFQRGFALGRFEVTVEEFGRFVENSGYVPTSQKERRSTVYDERSGSLAERRGVTWRNDYAGATADPMAPVVHVSFVDAEAYVAWLSMQTGASYRLPSEAELEYVLRAGSSSRFPWGDDGPTRLVGNLTGDGDRSPSRRTWSNAFKNYSDGFWGPAPVGTYEPNAFGIHDINGNVSEWTLDCWHDTYARGPVDGSAWVNPGCARRVIRGGSWASSPDQVRSAFRVTASPSATNARVGIRVARDL